MTIFDLMPRPAASKPDLTPLPPIAPTVDSNGNLVFTVPNPGTDTQAQIIAFAAQHSRWTCYMKNLALAATYVATQFGNWLTNYKAGRVDDLVTPPPAPPKGFMTVPVVDANNPDYLNFDEQQIGPPVCEVPSYDRIPRPQVEVRAPGAKPNPHVGMRMGPSVYWAAKDDDNEPEGYQTIPIRADDGTVGIFSKHNTPFGGIYELLHLVQAAPSS